MIMGLPILISCFRVDFEGKFIFVNAGEADLFLVWQLDKIF